MSTMNITPRRKDRTITEEQAEKILDTGEYGFLSLISDDEYPYGVPINYVKVGRAIYMHCAPEGRKIDCVKKNANASFCVVGNATVCPRQFSLDYSSAIAFGKVSICEESEKLEALRKIAKRFAPQFMKEADFYISKSAPRTTILRFDIEAVSGKAKHIIEK